MRSLKSNVETASEKVVYNDYNMMNVESLKDRRIKNAEKRA